MLLGLFLIIPQLSASAAQNRNATHYVRRWNTIAIDASGLDHTASLPFFGSQLGPGRASRAMAIVHIAMYDAVNAVSGRFPTYSDLHRNARASMDAALVQAAHDTLVALFPLQAPAFDEDLVDDLNSMPAGRRQEKTQGIALGKAAAAAILALRANDGSQFAEEHVGVDFTPNTQPGFWRPDPVSLLTTALGAKWGAVKPFVLSTPEQFRAPTPPVLTSAEYTAAFNEVKALGGDGITTPTTRTPDQTIIGTFWAYDGTPSLCAPPRLYNQIAMTIADLKGTSSDVGQLTRLLALVNIAMADAGVAIWESKYFYQYWRPVTGIREADVATGPSGLGDNNPDTAGDPAFTPLGAPASNLIAVNFTPPFPSYPSGHAGFGGALFEVLRRFYRTDKVAFSFTSDEFNGVTKDHSGAVRPLITRNFSSLSQAEEENGQSRIYLGIHWKFDKDQGIAQGRKIGDWVFDHAFHRGHGNH